MRNHMKLAGFLIANVLIIIFIVIFIVSNKKENIEGTSGYWKKIEQQDKQVQKQLLLWEKLRKWNLYIDKHCALTEKITVADRINLSKSSTDIKVNKNIYKCANDKQYIVYDNLDEDILSEKRTIEDIPEIAQ